MGNEPKDLECKIYEGLIIKTFVLGWRNEENIRVYEPFTTERNYRLFLKYRESFCSPHEVITGKLKFRNGIYELVEKTIPETNLIQKMDINERIKDRARRSEYSYDQEFTDDELDWFGEKGYSAEVVKEIYDDARRESDD